MDLCLFQSHTDVQTCTLHFMWWALEVQMSFLENIPIKFTSLCVIATFNAIRAQPLFLLKTYGRYLE